jgi:hypothetical protein
MLAELWRLVWRLLPGRKREVVRQEQDLHDLYHRIAKRNHLPSLRSLRRIQRKLDKLDALASSGGVQ